MDSESIEETVVIRRGRVRPCKVRGGRGWPRSGPQQRSGTKRQQSPVSETVSALDERKKDIEVTNTYKYKFLEKVFNE